MTNGLIGQTLGGRYEIKGLLGEGGMAQVYEAMQPRLDRKVAIKLLHRHLSSDEEFKLRFEREAQAIAQLKHPHIIQVYDFDYDETLKQFYMVIEYIDGPTLSTVIKQAPHLLPLAQSLKIIEDLADALGYAHSQQMQHRDIKPSNIMLDRGTRTVLTDFGIAKLVREGSQQLTASGALVGTPAYISPEQASGIPGDHRSDIYSLGIVFFQLVTGRLPYEGETPIATILKHLNEAPPPPTSLNSDLPTGVEAVILRSIAKSPDARYQSTTDLLKHLHNLDAAAADIDKARGLANQSYADSPFNRPYNVADGAPTIGTDTSLTDTLATAPRHTSLLIVVGAVGIISLLIVGALLFSTAGKTNDSATETPSANACLLILPETLFARPEPNQNITASIEFAADTEVEVIGESSSFWLISDQTAEGWVSGEKLTVPDDCQPG